MMSQPIVANTIEVPYLAATAIEADAQSLLEYFSGKFYLLTNPPVPVDEIAELHLHLTLEFKDMKEIFPFADIHGAIWFDSGLIGIDTSLAHFRATFARRVSVVPNRSLGRLVATAVARTRSSPATPPRFDPVPRIARQTCWRIRLSTHPPLQIGG